MWGIVSKWLRCYIEKEIEIRFEKGYHIVDSEIVKAVINKGSYGFNAFAANRIGEIHKATVQNKWYWLEGKLNLADWITGGRSPFEVHEDSVWQRAPTYLQLPEKEWPIYSKSKTLPEDKY